MVIIIVLTNAVGEVSIAKGMRQIGEISTLHVGELLKIAWRVLTNKFFALGLALMTLNFFVFLALLSSADLSLVVPATSLGFVIKTFAAKIFLKERISRERLIGTLLVCVGVALISLPE
jgi:drug/metabolite transporter (DMT)-like permease